MFESDNSQDLLKRLVLSSGIVVVTAMIECFPTCYLPDLNVRLEKAAAWSFGLFSALQLNMILKSRGCFALSPSRLSRPASATRMCTSNHTFRSFPRNYIPLTFCRHKRYGQGHSRAHRQALAVLRSFLLFLIIRVVLAAVSTTDPGDYACLPCDAADNAIIADYHVEIIFYLTLPLEAPYYFNGSASSFSHDTFCVKANDTSVIIVANGGTWNGSYITVVKEGFSSNLVQASFFGVNAAINVQNASIAYLDHLNVTVHNGAANVFSYGNDSVVHISDSSLYSSGPNSHGLFAAGNGTIYANNVQHYAGGMRSSSFSGDHPGGSLYIYNSFAHTSGIGSATFFTFGDVHAYNVIGIAERAPAMFLESVGFTEIFDCDLSAGLLAGFVIFSSDFRLAGAEVTFTDSRLTTTGADMPALWFGNTIATVNIVSSELVTKSGILVTANYSQVTQDFDYYAGYPDNNFLSPAEGTVSVEESTLVGDLVAYNRSTIVWKLSSHSSWTGKAYVGFDAGYFHISLDSTSMWTLTGDTTLSSFTCGDSTFGNIVDNGFNIYYDSSSSANEWLECRTYKLSGGGRVTPISSRDQELTKYSSDGICEAKLRPALAHNTE